MRLVKGLTLVTLLGVITLLRIQWTVVLRTTKNGIVWSGSSSPSSSPSSSALALVENDRSLFLVPLNPNSSFASDVQEIWHDQENYKICVAFRPGARCADPQLLGRLSGPTLTLLESWHWDPRFSIEHNNFTALCGSYQSAWLMPGQQYFVEILVLFCHNFGIETLETRITNDPEKTEDAWLHYNFLNTCIENQRNSRLTQDGAYIDINHDDVFAGPGRWRLRTTTRTRSNLKAFSQPLYTRQQLPECRRPNQTDRLFCSERTNASLLHSFEFEWNNNDSWIRKLQRYQREGTDFVKNITDCQQESLHIAPCVEQTQHFYQNNSLPKICLVGYSHSYWLTYSMMMINFSNQVRWIPTRFPEQVNLEKLSNYHRDYNCVKFVIATGQWAAGNPLGNAGYLFHDFYSKMSQVLHEMAKIPSSDSFGFQVFMRSIHRVPIRQLSAICPPKDWRSPTVMDGYSYLVRKAVADINRTDIIRYIDTSFITSPLWDMSHDWNHLPRMVSDIEAMYILGAVHGLLPPSAISDKSILPVIYQQDM